MIVILGIIALIITPVITGVIKKQEKKTFEESVRGILKSIEIDLSDDSFNVPREYFYDKGKLTLLTVGNNTKNETVKTNGKLNGSGYFLVDIDGDIIIDKVCDETYCASNSKEDPDLIIKEKDENEDPVLDQLDPIITLNGETTMYVELGGVWNDPGSTAKTRGGDTLEYVTEIKEGSTTIDSIDTSTEGTYKVTYSTTSNNKTVSVTRNVVVLSMNPVITITEPKNIYVQTQNVVINVSSSKTNTVSSFDIEIKKDGVTSSNETVTGKTKTITLNETGIYEVTVTVRDNNNHTSTVTKTYKIDTVPPELTIPEDGSVKITEVSSFDPRVGVTATDNTGIEPTIEVSGELGSTLGSYPITYKAIDEAGNEASKTRTITVVEAEGPILNFSDIGGNSWRKATTIKVTATDNNNLQNFTYEIIKDNVSQGVQNVSVSGKSAEKSITLNQDGIYTIKLTGSDIYGNTSSATSSTYKIDTTPPTAGTATFSGTLGSNDWYTSNVTVNVENGVDSLSGHSSTTSNISSITSNTEGKKVVITTTDLAGNSASRDYTIKVDKTEPTLTLKSTGSATITEGDNVESSTYYNTPTYSISGGSMSCSPTNTSSLSVGTRTVSCTARGGNGLTKTVNKTVVVNQKCPTYAIMGKNITTCDEIKTNDPGGNRRYVGANPNNYVRFNNELWRIIGIFNGQAKIIRNEFYSTSMAWDKNSSNGGHGSYGYNDWSTATLQAELNGTYLNGIEETSRGMIDENHVWKLGGTRSRTSEMTRAKMYGYERGTTVYTGNPTEWTGAVGLMYASDYGYSTSATDAECESTTMNGWNGTGNVANCKNNSWLTNSSNHQWTLSPSSSYENFVFLVHATGYVLSPNANNTNGVRPVLYLKSDVKITSGTGSSTDPYELTYSSGPVSGS